jgi:hypothetical protein
MTKHEWPMTPRRSTIDHSAFVLAASGGSAVILLISTNNFLIL